MTATTSKYPVEGSSQRFEPSWLAWDVTRLRDALAHAERSQRFMGRLWCFVRDLALSRPAGNPWLLPLVAAVTQDEPAIKHAKAAIDCYLRDISQRGDSEYLFNIWCFAFPHARWMCWFELLRQCGYYDETEAQDIAARFLLVQLRDNYPGMLVKPYPEIVDNQAASLAVSCYVVGTLGQRILPGSAVAMKLRSEGAARLEAMIGGMPASGYGGEGSTYQAHVVANVLPFLIESLEHWRGCELFHEPLPPNGTTARDVMEVTVLTQMPGNLLWPWDQYGYGRGCRLPLAYLAARTGEARYADALNDPARWTGVNHDLLGWGWDEPAWSLVYWASSIPTHNDAASWQSWMRPQTAGALTTPDGRLYLAQIWDRPEPMCVRSHVNPNSLTLLFDEVPLTADGSPRSGKVGLEFPGAKHFRSFGAGSSQQSIDMSQGCGGAHNILLIDGDEAFRPRSHDFPDAMVVHHDLQQKELTVDVTGLYRDVYPDCMLMRRRSRLVHDRFWLVEDLARFGSSHRITSRWWFRPDTHVVPQGVEVATAQGVRLQMRVLLGEQQASVRRVADFPFEPDPGSDCVDFTTEGDCVRWLYALWPLHDRVPVAELTQGWKAWPIDTPTQLPRTVPAQVYDLHPGLPPWLLSHAPMHSHWCYQGTFARPQSGQLFFRLPRGLGAQSCVWIDDQPVNWQDSGTSPLVAHSILVAPSSGNEPLRITITQSFAMDHHPQSPSHILSRPDRPAAWLAPVAVPDAINDVSWRDNRVKLLSHGGMTVDLPWTLLPINAEHPHAL
jgi:hypothetical protein